MSVLEDGIKRFKVAMYITDDCNHRAQYRQYPRLLKKVNEKKYLMFREPPIQIVNNVRLQLVSETMRLDRRGCNTLHYRT